MNICNTELSDYGNKPLDKWTSKLTSFQNNHGYSPAPYLYIGLSNTNRTRLDLGLTVRPTPMLLHAGVVIVGFAVTVCARADAVASQGGHTVVC